MKADMTELLRARMLDEKIAALEDVLTLLRGDLYALTENYMKLSGDIYIAADIDARNGDVLLNICIKAKEVYDCGKILNS